MTRALRSRAAIRCWYAVIAGLAAVGLIGQLLMLGGEGAGEGVVDYFSYFTVQSNLLVGVMATLIAIEPERHGLGFQILRLAALCAITVTGLVYGTLIGPYVNPTGLELVLTSILHYVVPPLTVLAFFVAGPREEISPRALWFIVWPLAWLAYTLARPELGDPSFPREDGSVSSYPYSFIDLDLHSAGYVAVAIAAVAGLLLVLATLYIWVNRRLMDS